MDQFLISTLQKENEEIIGRGSYIKRIKSLLEANTSFCIYGTIGVGKTFLIEHVLANENYIEVSSEHIKNEFLDKIKNTWVHVLLDDLEVSEPLSLGSTIIISNKIIENFECIKLEPLSHDDIILLGLKKFPKMSRDDISKSAVVSRGDLRNFLYNLQNFKGVRDLFKSPKDLVYDLVCTDGTLDPHDYVCKTINEHGYSWGIVHENYLDARGCIDDMAVIAECMSCADIKDEDIYSGYSSHTGTSIFNLYGIILPAIEIDHSLDRDTMRPGSAWTKFNNYKMRYHRYQSTTNRKIQSTMDVDSLMVLSTYCKTKSDEVIDILTSYGFESADIDMMNHLSLINKIKPRVLQVIKNKLKLLTKN